MIKLLLMFIILLPSCSEGNEFNKDTLQTNENTNSFSDNNRCDFSMYKPITISHFVQFSLVKKYNPSYPEEAVKRNIQGIVSVKILVNGNGEVIKACALDGNKALWQASEDAALKWKFRKTGRKSYVVDGISFNYILDKDSSTKEDSDVVYPQ